MLLKENDANLVDAYILLRMWQGILAFPCPFLWIFFLCSCPQLAPEKMNRQDNYTLTEHNGRHASQGISRDWSKRYFSQNLGWALHFGYPYGYDRISSHKLIRKQLLFYMHPTIPFLPMSPIYPGSFGSGETVTLIVSGCKIITNSRTIKTKLN